MERFKIDVAHDFSQKLGGRWKSLGPSSGELFYESHLLPKYKEAIDANDKLHIYLDGTKGYGSSFLDQSFGELARQFGASDVAKTLVFHTQFFNWEVNYIKNEIWGKK